MQSILARLTGWLVIIFYGVPLITQPLYQTDSLAPYIYYYSTQQNAFVIERADGTDQHVLASFQLPSPINNLGEGFLTGPGWSSSGEWFAWSHRLENGIPSTDAYIIDQQGNNQRQVQISDDLMVRQMHWHPDQDLLLLYLETYTPDNEETYIRLYDPNQNTVVLPLDVYDMLGRIGKIYDVSWSPNGQYITVWSSQVVSVLDLTGREIASFPMQTSGSYYGCQELPFWLDEQNLAYFNTETATFVIQDILEAQTKVEIEFTEERPVLIDVSPNQGNILLYTQKPGNNRFEFLVSLWHVVIEDGSTTFIADGIIPFYNCDDSVQDTAWKNDDEAVFASAEGNFSLYSNVTDNVRPILINADGQWVSGSPIRWYEDDLIFLWANTDTLPVTSLYVYDTEAHEVKLIVEGQAFSEPSQYISPINEGRVTGSDFIVDIPSRSSESLSEHEIGTRRIRKVEWDSSGEWLIALSSAEGYGLLDVYVERSDGTYQRRIATCLIDSLSCYGWFSSKTD